MQSLLESAGIGGSFDSNCELDHGEFVPLKLVSNDAGATLTCRSDDPAVITAIHEWFQASTTVIMPNTGSTRSQT